MPDPVSAFNVTAIVVGGAVLVSQDLLKRLLGSTFDYLGDSLREYAEKRMETSGRIVLNGVKKLGDRLDTPGQVSPRVLRTILEEGSYSDNDIAVDYFGGVLASSRTEFSRDDRGARIARMIDSLSAYQIRTHYLIYSSISHLFSRDKNSFALSEDREKMQLFMPSQGFFESMEFSLQEWSGGEILNHILHGLSTDGLIQGKWGFGDTETVRKFSSKIPSSGIVCTPSALGAELFLWAFGHGDKDLDFLLDRNISTEIEGIPSLVPGTIGIKSSTVQNSEQAATVE